ncbi:hypothetical protein KIH27_19080 [Mycobacterium sp. M1]|uniref:Uncharacterized protein n=1 Tax=Mycolicibacter acidiphilus TaxID=2835306 RepID=A0ABS5RN04_9MYCO|nr:hypothetical protein [Mycolicibacter acidiphilus]
MSDTDGVIVRFTKDLWPAIAACNGVCDQGGKNYVRLHQLYDPNADPGLRQAVQGLGQADRDSVMSGNPFRDMDGIRLGSAVLTALNPPTAALKVCYTYTLTLGADNPMPPQPTASEVTVELHKTDAWYLHSITNDHVVSSCGDINS